MTVARSHFLSTCRADFLSPMTPIVTTVVRCILAVVVIVVAAHPREEPVAAVVCSVAVVSSPVDEVRDDADGGCRQQ